MTTYSERTARRPDFRVRYEWISDQAAGLHQKVLQHIRCDFSYEGDDVMQDGVYMVWPEFEDEDGNPFPEGAVVPAIGTASMWIVSPDMRVKAHREKAQLGTRGYFVVGSKRIARAEIVEIIGIHDDYRPALILALKAIEGRTSNRVGGGVSPADLPHHRAYGSVHGGSGYAS